MNIFLEDKLEIQDPKQIKGISYSLNKEEPILAIIRENTVDFYDDNNQKLPFTYTAPSPITSYVWNPFANKIVIGTQRGEIEIYDTSNGSVSSENLTHANSEIKLIKFSLSGELMVTSDNNYIMAFWVDIIPIKVEARGAPISKVIFVDFTHEKKDKTRKMIKLIFIGDKMGNIDYLEEKRLITQELCSLNGAIKELFFYPKTNTIIVITSTFYYIQFKISTEEDIVPDKKVKLPMAGSPDRLRGLWISPESFVLNSKEHLIRFWNVNKGKNYAVNVFDYVGEGKERKLSVEDIQYDTDNRMLYAYLSNREVLVLKANSTSMVEDGSDWKKISVIKVEADNMVDMRISYNSFCLLTTNKVHLYKRTKIKLFIEEYKNFKLLQKSLKTIEFFNSTDKENNSFNLNEKIDDFLVNDDQIIFLTMNKEIFSLKTFEMITNANKKDFRVDQSRINLNGYKKLNKVFVNSNIKKIVLTRFGYCGIENSQKLHFINYKNERIIEFRTTKENVYYIDVITNTSYDKIALLDNKFNVKIFETSKNNLKLVHENINLIETIDEVKKKSSKGEEQGSFEFDDLLGLEEETVKQVSMTDIVQKRVKVEKILINNDGNKIFMITNAEHNNMILINLRKGTNHALSHVDGFKAEDCLFDSSDDRFVVVKGVFPNEQEALLILVIMEDTFKIFNQINLQPNSYLLNSSFPETFISNYGSNNEILVNSVFPDLFNDASLKENATKHLRDTLKDFCYYLTIENLQQAVNKLKRIENSFEMSEFWKKLLELSLKSRNLKIAEMCLTKMKSVKVSRYITEVAKKDKLSSKEKLGSLALILNKVNIAKKIFFEDNNYQKISEILYLEGKYDKLIEFCKKYDKSLVNYYRLKIAIKYYDDGMYKRFTEEARKSGVNSAFVINKLIQAGRVDILEKQQSVENSYDIVKALFKYYHNKNDIDKAESVLQEFPQKNKVAVDYYLQKKDNIEQAKKYSNSKENENNKCLLLLANKLEEKEEYLDAIDLMIKGKFYVNAVKLIQNNQDFFQKNENTLQRINDLIYDYIVQAENDFRVRYIADYFLKIDYKEKAVKLYLKANQQKLAYKLAKRYKYNHLISQIEQSFNQRRIILKEKNNKKAKYSFNSSKSFAVNSKEAEFEILLKDNDYNAALEYIKSDNVKIKKGHVDLIKKSDYEKKDELLYLIAKKWKKAGKFERAINLYVDLKDNVKALKTMIKDNRTPQIIQFANFARQEDIYEMAANYLQTCNMKFDDKVFKAICSFYIKAKKLPRLIDFLFNLQILEFADQNFENCFKILERIKKLSMKTSAEVKNELLIRIQNDTDFILNYSEVIKSHDNGDYEKAKVILKDILVNKPKTKLFVKFEVEVTLLKNLIELGETEEIKELVKVLTNEGQYKFVQYLTNDERNKVLEICPSLTKEPGTEENLDEIDELLI